MNDSIAIGIAGTAKNTGKTTALSAIMEEARKQELPLALTSIGYDGEHVDNVTGLPKPRIHVWPGMLVAVAEGCLPLSEAELAAPRKTGMQTPLGEILVGRVSKGGMLVVAGPNKRRELKEMLELLRAEGAALTIVDGALSRISPLAMVDGLIISTGAARTTDLQRLALETESMLSLLNTPVPPASAALPERGEALRCGSLLSAAARDAFIERMQNADTAVIEGVIAEGLLLELPRYQNVLAGKRLQFSDPTKLLMGENIVNIARCVQQLSDMRVEVGVANAVHPIAVTVNPYFPKYRYSGDNYEAMYVDREELHAVVSRAAERGGGIPCFDVVRQGGGAIFKRILQYWKERA